MGLELVLISALVLGLGSNICFGTVVGVSVFGVCAVVRGGVGFGAETGAGFDVLVGAGIAVELLSCLVSILSVKDV